MEDYVKRHIDRISHNATGEIVAIADARDRDRLNQRIDDVLQACGHLLTIRDWLWSQGHVERATMLDTVHDWLLCRQASDSEHRRDDLRWARLSRGGTR